MDPATLTLTAVLVSCLVSLLSLIRSGRKDSAGDAKTTGQEWGELKSDIRHIKDDVQEIKGDVKDTKADYMKELAELNRQVKESVRRVHKRIDDHEEKYHGKIITRNEEDEV